MLEKRVTLRNFTMNVYYYRELTQTSRTHDDTIVLPLWQERQEHAILQYSQSFGHLATFAERAVLCHRLRLPLAPLGAYDKRRQTHSR